MAKFSTYDYDQRAARAGMKSKRGKTLVTKARQAVMETLLVENNELFKATLDHLLKSNMLSIAGIALYMEVMRLVYPKWKKQTPKTYYENLDDAYYDYCRLTPNEKQNVRRRARQLDYTQYGDTAMFTNE